MQTAPVNRAPGRMDDKKPWRFVGLLTRRPLLMVGALLAVLGLLLLLLSRHGSSLDGDTSTLTVHCAAGLQKPLQEIAARYEREFGTRIRLNFAGSGVLASQLKVAGGDLFIPADDSYIESTRQQGWVSESVRLVRLRAVIVVPRGNPKKIRSLNDLISSDVRISIGEPSAAIGKHVREVLGESGHWQDISSRVVVTKPTVNNVVVDVASGAVDAGLAWDAVAAQYNDVDTVRVPVFEEHPRCASVGIIKGAKKAAALHFMRYLTARETGGKVFKGMHFALPDKVGTPHQTGQSISE